jgi:hypothetical protein
MARPFRLSNLPVAALLLATAGLATAALTLGNGDAVVEHSFQQALADMGERAGARARGADLIVSNRQKLNVTRTVHDGSMVAKPVSIGDRITISSGGHDRVLHVVKVDPLDSALVQASTKRPTPLLLVTCKDESNPNGRPVRFLIESDEPLPVLSSTAPRTL